MKINWTKMVKYGSWVLVMTMGLILAIVLSARNVKKNTVSSYETQLSTMIAGYAAKIDAELQRIQTAGSTVANMLAMQEEMDGETFKVAADAFMDSTQAYMVVQYRNGDPVRVAGKGMDEEKSRQLDALPDIGMLTYNMNDTDFIYLEDDGITGREVLLLSMPVGAAGSERLLIYYPITKITELLNICPDFDSNSFAVLTDTDGNILIKDNMISDFLTGTNLWERVDKSNLKSMARIKSAMHLRQSGVGNISSDQGEDRVMVYSPLRMMKWTLVAGINPEYVHEKTELIWKPFVRAARIISSLLLLYVIIYLYFLSGRNRQKEQNERVLQEKADTDLLTGLTNKLTTERLIREYMENNPDAMGLMFMIDIDNFKKINDTMGHAFGDEVLKTFGTHIVTVFRVSDIIGRTGGDEFTIFLKHIKSEENILSEAEKLIQFFEDFKAGEYVKYSATASIGAAVFPEHGKDFETLYKAADKALYTAKQRGKNQLAFYDDRDRK